MSSLGCVVSATCSRSTLRRLLLGSMAKAALIAATHLANAESRRVGSASPLCHFGDSTQTFERTFKVRKASHSAFRSGKEDSLFPEQL